MDAKKRADSVRRLKRLIIVTIVSVILLPTILCFVLFAKLHVMQRDIEDLEEARLEQEVEFALMMDSTGNSGEDYIVTREELNVSSPQIGEEEDIAENIQEQQQAIVFPEDTLPEGTRKVYLTFDDGPSAETNRILDILNEYDVKATFFVVGKTDEQFVPMYQRIVEDGHSLGMHSYSHKYREIYASVDAFSEDLTKIREYLYQVTGQEISLYRFPGGSSNQVSRVPIDKLISYLNEEKISYFDWNISSKDATGSYISADSIIANCMQNIEKYDTCVILMHDSPDKKSTVEALPRLIEKILSLENTVILPITEGTDLVQHRKASSVD